MPKKMTQEQTIEVFQKKFGKDRYDYSQVHYVNNTTKVAVICHKKGIDGKEHGVFWVTPKNHKKGRGCPKCAKNHPMDTEEFILKAKKAHPNDDYDYSLTHYTREHNNVKIICHRKDENGVEHGVFEQDPNAHLKGAGCPKCGLKKNHTEQANRLRHENGVKTNIERYGVINPMQLDKYKKKVQESIVPALLPNETMMHALNRIYDKDFFTDEQLNAIAKKWSVLKDQRIDVFKSMIGQYLKYGVFHFTQTEDYIRKSIATNQERYGANNFMQSQAAEAIKPALVAKIDASKRAHHTYNTSKIEDQIYKFLCKHFGKDDVVRQYRNEEVYPFACDFYIKSRDLYIEVNGTWTHNDCWYDPQNSAHVAEAKAYLNKGTSYYQRTYDTWTKKDPEKREYARKNNLNYIVFWDSSVPYDYMFWASLGYPNGHDWDHEYSWFPKMQDFPAYQKPSMLSSAQAFELTAKFYQLDVFYQKEIEMWNTDTLIDKDLFVNRYKYLHKLPNELTQARLLTAFKVSGKYHGYSSFDVTAMNEVIDKYHITSVIDPCAGWGERMLDCYEKGIKYYGYDVNGSLEKGYEQIKEDYGMTQQHFHVANSQKVRFPKNKDAVITCPPYFDTEKYSEDGAENLPYLGFLRWWQALGKKAHNAGTKYFCFQINQKYKDDMLQKIEECGYTLVDKINLRHKISHLNRIHGNIKKHEYETMLVLQRID